MLGRVPSAPRLADPERFNIAKSAHDGGYPWQPEEWAAHAGHCPPGLPEKFIPTRRCSGRWLSTASACDDTVG